MVTTSIDPSSGNGAPSNCPANNSPASSNCSLRDAVAAANALLAGIPSTVSPVTISFAGSAVGTAGNPAIIQIAQSTPITINQSVNINGPGANLLTIEGAQRRRTTVDDCRRPTISVFSQE